MSVEFSGESVPLPHFGILNAATNASFSDSFSPILQRGARMKHATLLD